MDQKLKSELTQQLIIDRAFELFYMNGYKATSVGAIMKATSLTKGAFYHHFKNKQEIGLAVLDQKVKRRIYNEMIAPLYGDGSAVSILKDVFTRRIRSFTEAEKKAGCPVNNLINEIGDTEIAYQIALRKIIEEWKAALVAILEKGKRAATIKKEIDSTTVAIYLISAFEGVRGLRKLYPDDEILEDFLTALNDYIDQLL